MFTAIEERIEAVVRRQAQRWHAVVVLHTARRLLKRAARKKLREELLQCELHGVVAALDAFDRAITAAQARITSDATEN